MPIEKINTKSEYQIADIGDMHAYCHIGGKDSQVGDKVVPNANFSWQCATGLEQFFLNVNRASVSVFDEKETFQNDELKLKIGDNTDIWKVVDGRLKWDIEFNRKPATNVFEWDITFSAGLKFEYQDSIENDHKNFGYKEYPLLAYQAKYRRPENVVGSYAIRCYLRNRMLGEYDYGTGKLGHIYRPLVIDADNNQVWADLFIDPDLGILRITIPQAFLDTAVYPVRLDPTFGYDTIGASETDIDRRIYINNVDSPASNGTATSVDLYWRNRAGSNADIHVGLYDDNAGTPYNLMATEDAYVLLSSESTDAWRQYALDPNISVLAAKAYWSTCDSDQNDRCEVHYDSCGGCGDLKLEGGIVHPWPDPATFDDTYNYNYSVRTTYTIAGALEININDTVTITENVDPTIKALNIDVNDTVTVQEALD